MIMSGTAQSVCLAFLMAVASTGMPIAAADAQTVTPTTSPVPALPSSGTTTTLPAPSDVNDLRPLTQDASLLSIPGGQRLMAEANQAVAAQNYDLAIKKLQEARQVFNQLSNFHQDLASSFTGIDNRIADAQRRKALETAQMRDDATYQLALVHRAQNQPELAVPLLIQIVRSQQPTRDLGKKAYQQLFELGFVDSPFSRDNTSQSR
jgi:hypothetical protein